MIWRLAIDHDLPTFYPIGISSARKLKLIIKNFQKYCDTYRHNVIIDESRQGDGEI